MEQFTDLNEMSTWASDCKQRRELIALVPTMGALHQGHHCLVYKGRGLADKLVVSIFVNPAQFNNADDFAAYPDTLETDLEMLAILGVDAVFLPNASSLYPNKFETYITPGTMAERLCGATRPGHFRGVCTVVQILFAITKCDKAVFGAKDYQQLQVIRTMVKDLWLSVGIIAVPTVRDSNGLALSSRNRHLLEDDYAKALAIPKTLNTIKQGFQRGQLPKQLIAQGLSQLNKAGISNENIDYLEIVNGETLKPLTEVQPGAICLLAAHIGKTRLIDNIALQYLQLY